MTVIKKILVASDLSDYSTMALTRAASLARRHGAALSALHVIDPVRPTETGDWMWPAGMPPAELEARAATEARADLARQLADSGTSIHTRTGKPFVEIIQQARAEQADLVVMGAHGRRFLHDLLLGTTTERVVRKGDRPVLTVKLPPQGDYRQVLVAVDFSDTCVQALQFAAVLAPDASITVLHAYELWYEGKLRTGGANSDDVEAVRRLYAQQALERAREFVQNAGFDPDRLRLLVRHGYPASVITQVTEELNTDLVALGTHGQSVLHYVLLGSVAEHVLREARADVLLVRPPAIDFTLP